MKLNLTEQQIQIIVELMHLGIKRPDTNIQQTMAFSNIVSYIDIQVKKNKEAKNESGNKDSDKPVKKA